MTSIVDREYLHPYTEVHCTQCDWKETDDIPIRRAHNLAKEHVYHTGHRVSVSTTNTSLYVPQELSH